MPMIALPSRSFTDAISPTSTPAMLTVWPWPGVTACAVDISASISKKSLPTSGTQAGSASRCLPRITVDTAAATISRPRMARKSGRCLRIAVFTSASPAAGAALGAERVELLAHGLRGRPRARSLSRSDVTCAVLAADARGADFAAAGPLTSGSFCV